MRRIPVFVLAPLVLGLLVACDPQALQRRQAALAPWVGQGEDALVRGLGVPTRTYEASGHRFLAYDETSTQILSPFQPWSGGWGWGGGYGWGGGLPAEVVQHTCETTFEVVGGRVSGYSLRGNACG